MLFPFDAALQRIPVRFNDVGLEVSHYFMRDWRQITIGYGFPVGPDPAGTWKYCRVWWDCSREHINTVPAAVILPDIDAVGTK